VEGAVRLGGGTSAMLVFALFASGTSACGQDVSTTRPLDPAHWAEVAASASGTSMNPGRSTVNTPQLQTMVQLAMTDAARRTKRDPSKLSVVMAEAVTWPDGALGCPQPGMAYTQALVPGYRIRIAAGDETLEYHGSARGQPFFCPASRITGPTTDSRI
jgi:hypothetical protein